MRNLRYLGVMRLISDITGDAETPFFVQDEVSSPKISIMLTGFYLGIALFKQCGATHNNQSLWIDYPSVGFGLNHKDKDFIDFGLKYMRASDNKKQFNIICNSKTAQKEDQVYPFMKLTAENLSCFNRQSDAFFSNYYFTCRKTLIEAKYNPAAGSQVFKWATNHQI